MYVSEQFIVGINKQISIMLKSVKTCHFEVRSYPQNSAFMDFLELNNNCLNKQQRVPRLPLACTLTFYQFIFFKRLLFWINNCVN